jgi:C1A family cysteine protease
MKIDDVHALAPYAHALKALGYSTTEMFEGAVRASPQAMSSFLETDAQALLQALPHQARAGAAAQPPRRFPLGAALHRIPPTRAAFHRPRAALVAPAPLPAKVDLIPQMPPIRNQGDRGTCVAHASLAMAEHLAGTQNQYEDMSEQFVYCLCKQQDNDPTGEGTWIAVAVDVLAQVGCCLENTWPYNPGKIAGNEGQGPVPAAAAAQAAQYKVPPYHELAGTSVQDIKSELARQRCVAFDIPVYNSWYGNPEVTRTGDIGMPIPGEVPLDGGHAMCFVGYEDLPGLEELGGGRFVLRNSWGNAWATQSSTGTVGFGTIPYAYIAAYGREAYSLS